MVTGHSNVSALDAVYRATAYVVELERGAIPIRIGELSLALDRLLQAHRCKDWAFISACNPGSQPVPDTQNIERHAQLVAAVNHLGLSWFTGHGVPDHPGWPAEISLLVLGISPDDAMRLASQFGQNAIVAGAAGTPAQLCYVHGN